MGSVFTATEAAEMGSLNTWCSQLWLPVKEVLALTHLVTTGADFVPEEE